MKTREAIKMVLDNLCQFLSALLFCALFMCDVLASIVVFKVSANITISVLIVAYMRCLSFVIKT